MRLVVSLALARDEVQIPAVLRERQHALDERDREIATLREKLATCATQPPPAPDEDVEALAEVAKLAEDSYDALRVEFGRAPVVPTVKVVRRSYKLASGVHARDLRVNGELLGLPSYLLTREEAAHLARSLRRALSQPGTLSQTGTTSQTGTDGE